MGREPLNFTSVFLTLTAMMPSGLEPPSLVVNKIVEMANRNPACDVYVHPHGQLAVVSRSDWHVHPEWMLIVDKNGVREKAFTAVEAEHMLDMYRAHSLFGLGGVG